MICERCKGPLDRESQCVLPGTGVPTLCAGCGRTDDASAVLARLPQKGLTPRESALVRDLRASIDSGEHVTVAKLAKLFDIEKRLAESPASEQEDRP